jgi:hypothetical protein
VASRDRDGCIPEEDTSRILLAYSHLSIQNQTSIGVIGVPISSSSSECVLIPPHSRLHCGRRIIELQGNRTRYYLCKPTFSQLLEAFDQNVVLQY